MDYLIGIMLAIGLAMIVIILFEINHLVKLLDGTYDDDEPMPDQNDGLSDEQVSDLLGSEELQIKNEEHDRKIKAIIDELEAKQSVGTVYDLPHATQHLHKGEEYAE